MSTSYGYDQDAEPPDAGGSMTEPDEDGGTDPASQTEPGSDPDPDPGAAEAASDGTED